MLKNSTIHPHRKCPCGSKKKHRNSCGKQNTVKFHDLPAIDGHAKNLSLHIKAGDKYRLAPLYDIMSAHPLISNNQLQAKKIKMAMALKGKNNHYHWQDEKNNRMVAIKIFNPKMMQE